MKKEKDEGRMEYKVYNLLVEQVSKLFDRISLFCLVSLLTHRLISEEIFIQIGDNRDR